MGHLNGSMLRNFKGRYWTGYAKQRGGIKDLRCVIDIRDRYRPLMVQPILKQYNTWSEVHDDWWLISDRQVAEDNSRKRRKEADEQKAIKARVKSRLPRIDF